MSLSYSELWFLETAVDARILFGFLPETARERAQAFSPQWNSPTHGLTVQGVAETLWLLHRMGNIHFHRYRVDDDEPIPFSPSSPSELFTLIVDGRRLLQDFYKWRAANHARPQAADPPPWDLHYTYSMTRQGVVRWEEYARPDWSRFRGDFDGRLYEPGETFWSADALSESFAREMMEVESLDIVHPARIHWESAVTEDLASWEPIEGKILPEGVKLSVKVTELDGRAFQMANPARAAEQHQEHWRRFRKLCRPWYKNGVRNHPDRPQPQS